MKIKKLLASVLAGAMVVGSVMSVSATETISATAWWTERECSTAVALASDSTVVLNVTVDADIDGYAAFCVEINEDDADYFTTTSSCDGWLAGNSSGVGTVSGDGWVSGGNGDIYPVAGETYVITITNSGSDFTITYYNKTTSTTVCTVKATGTTFPMENAGVYVMAQVGTFTVTEGEVASDDTEEEEEAEEVEEETVVETATTGEASTIVLFMVAMVAIAGTAFTMKKAR